jgi:hypothetical protein
MIFRFTVVEDTFKTADALRMEPWRATSSK